MWSKADISTAIFGAISNLVLLIGLALGLYIRWKFTSEIIILWISITGLFVYSISLALVYYFSMYNIGNSLFRLYSGCMLGIVAFTAQPSFRHESYEISMNMLLMGSLVIRCLNQLFKRFVKPALKQAVLMDSFDFLEILGMMIASLTTGDESLAISLLVASVAITLVTIRLNSWLGVLNLVFIILITRFFYFPKVLPIDLHINLFALACFVGRISFEPIIDLYFCTLSTLQRWQPILSLSSLKRKLLILLVVAIQVSFFSIIARRMPSHKEWLIVVPLFAAFSVVWVSFHLVFLVTCWLLTNKITECWSTYDSLSDDGAGDATGARCSMNRILASRGVRHFSLISQRLVFITVLSSVVVGLLGWTPKTPLSLSLFFIVVSIESAVLSLLWELGSALGGTCVGYAMVAPSLTVR